MMNKLDKLVEDKIKADGWIKLLPTEKCQTSQPHRFRYTDGKTTSVSIIQYGALAGVYQGDNWQEKYEQVNWDADKCNCDNCLFVEASEESTMFAHTAATIARRFEGLTFDQDIDIANLHIEQTKNGYKKVTFLYKVEQKL